MLLFGGDIAVFTDNRRRWVTCLQTQKVLIFLYNQVSQDLDTRESLHTGDAAKQTAKTMQNIQMLLEEAGTTIEAVCRIVVYLTDIRYREAVYQEMGKWLKGVHPCSTGLVVPALARPEWVVEIEVTAVIPD